MWLLRLPDGALTCQDGAGSDHAGHQGKKKLRNQPRNCDALNDTLFPILRCKPSTLLPSKHQALKRGHNPSVDIQNSAVRRTNTDLIEDNSGVSTGFEPFCCEHRRYCREYFPDGTVQEAR